jgi:hypothetical protein
MLIVSFRLTFAVLGRRVQKDLTGFVTTIAVKMLVVLSVRGDATDYIAPRNVGLCLECNGKQFRVLNKC